MENKKRLEIGLEIISKTKIFIEVFLFNENRFVKCSEAQIEPFSNTVIPLEASGLYYILTSFERYYIFISPKTECIHIGSTKVVYSSIGNNSFNRMMQQFYICYGQYKEQMMIGRTTDEFFSKSNAINFSLLLQTYRRDFYYYNHECGQVCCEITRLIWEEIKASYSKLPENRELQSWQLKKT